MSEIYLGIDAGTTRIKAALVDSNGGILAAEDRNVKVLKPFEGACEIDMGLLWNQLCEITQQLRNECPQYWDNIKGIGISGQGDGVWPIDSSGSPVRNAILWNDTRGKSVALNDEEELGQYLIENSITPLVVGSAPLTLKWIKENEPENYSKISYSLHCKDWLNYRLTGEVATDYSDASTAAINIFTKEYDRNLFGMLDISEAYDMMPPLYPTTHIVGHVTEAAAQQSGLPKGIPVIAGAIDVAAACLGAGVTKTGDGLTILGTTLCNEVLIDKSQVDIKDRNGSALCSIIPGKYVRVMAALSGNSTIDWAKAVLAPDLGFKEMEQELEKVPLGSRGVMYHPYIYGERSPFKDPFACGGFYGLTARHGRYDMMRAVYEGMVLSLKNCWNSLPQTDGKLYISGGGAVSDFTCQMIADALGKQVLRPDRKELGIYGIVTAIRMGLDENGGIPEFESAQCDTFSPDFNNTATFEQLYRNFMGLKDNMSGFWKARAEILGS